MLVEILLIVLIVLALIIIFNQEVMLANNLKIIVYNQVELDKNFTKRCKELEEYINEGKHW